MLHMTEPELVFPGCWPNLTRYDVFVDRARLEEVMGVLPTDVGGDDHGWC